MKKVLVVFGTRPEIIKLAPLVFALEKSKTLKAVTCATAQHRQLLDQVLNFFRIKPDYDLNLMQENQTLYDLTARCLGQMRSVLGEVAPSVVAVQGDTTTAFTVALASFYAKIPVAHVEAGLRTRQKYSPFPEEMNRKLISSLGDYHFAPTMDAMTNLKAEHISADSVFLTGNTGIDALLWAVKRVGSQADLLRLFEGKKLILMTAHRRENFGEPLETIFVAVREFLHTHPEFHVIYPVHPNPNVKKAAQKHLSGVANLSLVEPLSYPDLIFLLKECHLVLTDSGGLQEEAPSLGKPVLVLRESTERPEGVVAGCSRLVGHDPVKIRDSLEALREVTSALYTSMASPRNPFGDGTAAEQIVRILEKKI